jgi:hypothetical protein
MSDYNKRRVKYFDNQDRFSSNYTFEHIKKINPADYKEKSDKFRLDQYEYCHDENLKHIVGDKKKNEEDIRNRL